MQYIKLHLYHVALYKLWWIGWIKWNDIIFGICLCRMREREMRRKVDWIANNYWIIMMMAYHIAIITTTNNTKFGKIEKKKEKDGGLGWPRTKWKKEKIGKKRRKELVVITHHGLNRKIEKKKKEKRDLWSWTTTYHHHNYRLRAFIFNFLFLKTNKCFFVCKERYLTVNCQIEKQNKNNKFKLWWWACTSSSSSYSSQSKSFFLFLFNFSFSLWSSKTINPLFLSFSFQFSCSIRGDLSPPILSFFFFQFFLFLI